MDLNALLIKKLSGKQVLKTPSIVNAFYKIDRAKFVRQEYSERAYEDQALPIESGQTISQPSTLAYMLELLQPLEGEKVLDVGAGSGWSTALLGHIIGAKGRVYGVEIMPALMEVGRRNLLSAEIYNALIVPAEKTLGYQKEAPYNKILVSAYMDEVPQSLIDQLCDGGTMVIPIKNDIVKITKVDQNNIQIQNFPGFLFVPLINTEKTK